MGKYFGTDGFRGKANEGLTALHAYEIGRFLGWYYGREKRARIVLGKDTRRSSYMLEYALSAGAVASGADVYLLHVTTTPSVSYVARTEEFDCGVMISASHNPFDDNGIKLLNRSGEKLEDETISRIEAYLDRPEGEELPLAVEERIGRIVDHTAGRNRYMGYLLSLGVYSFEGKKIALDCANGSAWNIAPHIFEALGAQTFVINARPDGLNINRDAGSTHIEGLRRYVVEHHLDVGFAYDGDADRCLAVDEAGNLVDGDQILYIYGCYLKERDKLVNDTVVTTVMSNLGLYRAFDEAGIRYVKTAVGDKYVYEEMVRAGYSIGGEQSGHIILSQYARTGDGILTSIKLMEVMLAKKAPLSKLAAPVRIYPQVLLNVRVRDKALARADSDVQEAVRMAEQALGDGGRILVRESGTEPLIRVMVEAQQEERCRELARQVAAVLERKGHCL